MVLKITKKEWIIAWLEKKLGIISPSACVNGHKYRYDWFKTMWDSIRKGVDHATTKERIMYAYKQGKKDGYNEACMDQTNTEIARTIVHKIIDDAVIAEDAYPDLRQKLHDAVDEYEPPMKREGER